MLAGGAAYIKEIDIVAQDVTLKLSNAGDYKIEKFTFDNGKGTVGVDAAIVLKTGTVLSAADNKLNKIKFSVLML